MATSKIALIARLPDWTYLRAVRSTKFLKRVMRPSLKRKGSGFSVSLPDGKEIPFSYLKRYREFRQFLPELNDEHQRLMQG